VSKKRSEVKALCGVFKGCGEVKQPESKLARLMGLPCEMTGFQAGSLPLIFKVLLDAQ
jgi:hypothetical protein